jgi:hypothetical protein
LSACSDSLPERSKMQFFVIMMDILLILLDRLMKIKKWRNSMEIKKKMKMKIKVLKRKSVQLLMKLEMQIIYKKMCGPRNKIISLLITMINSRL